MVERRGPSRCVVRDSCTRHGRGGGAVGKCVPADSKMPLRHHAGCMSLEPTGVGFPGAVGCGVRGDGAQGQRRKARAACSL